MSEGGVDRRVGGRAFARVRCHRLCVIAAGTRRDAARLRDVSAAGATLDIAPRPPLGERVRLHHPEAGDITARVSRHTPEGIGLSFEASEAAVVFAMRALAIEITAAADG